MANETNNMFFSDLQINQTWLHA